jgi:hypothetical protein
MLDKGPQTISGAVAKPQWLSFRLHTVKLKSLAEGDRIANE